MTTLTPTDDQIIAGLALAVEAGTMTLFTPTVLCSWCDETATRNLSSKRDQACDAHHAQWFGPGFPPAE